MRRPGLSDVRHRRICSTAPGASPIPRCSSGWRGRSGIAAPTTTGCHADGQRRPRERPPRDHRHLAGRPPADGHGGRALRASSTTASSTTSASCAPSSRPAGTRSRSRTDTEVVLHAYQEWGPACLDRFDGMFAFAVWDERERELFLARDRFGIKPLYYAHARRPLRLRLRGQGAARGRLPAPRVAPPASSSTSPSRTSSRDATLFEGVRHAPRRPHARVSTDGVERRTAATGTSTSSRTSGASEDEWVERGRGRLRAGGDAAARQRRARSAATSQRRHGLGSIAPSRAGRSRG